MCRMKILLALFSIIVVTGACRTVEDEGAASQESDLLADATEIPDSTPISISDLDYQILKYFPLTIFVPEDSLKPWVDKVVGGPPRELEAIDKETTKDLQLALSKVDLIAGGLVIDFQLDFKFRKCVGVVCGWWQSVHTKNRAHFALTIDNWVLHAQLTEIKVDVQDSLLKATIGKIIEKEIATQIANEINTALAKASGQSLKEKITQRMRRPMAFLANRAKFDLDIQEKGLMIVVKGPLRSDTDAKLD